MRDTTGDKLLQGRKIVLLASTSEVAIAGKPVSTPLGGKADTGVIGDGGEKKRGEVVGVSLDTSAALGILMVDETGQMMGSLAN